MNAPATLPATIGKPAFAIGCGSFRLVDLIASLDPSLRVAGPAASARGGRSRRPWATGLPATGIAGPLCSQRRLAPRAALLADVKPLLARDAPLGGADAATPVLLARGAAGEMAHREAAHAQLASARCWDWACPARSANCPTFDYPHDIIRHHLLSLAGNLAIAWPAAGNQEIADGVFARAGTPRRPSTSSPIRVRPDLLEPRPRSGRFVFLRGAPFGRESPAIEHTAPKTRGPGHTTKIGGEVEGSIIEPYTNSNTMDSWATAISAVGSTWERHLQQRSEKTLTASSHGISWPEGVATGMQFVGCIVGEYAKTAINRHLHPARRSAPAAMLYGFVTTNVPQLRHYAAHSPGDRSAGGSAGGHAGPHVPPAARSTSGPADIHSCTTCYELTRHERRSLANRWPSN